MAERDRTASLMTPSKLAQMKPTAAATPAAWLSQMAADAGHLHVRRLRDLHRELQVQAPLRDVSPLVPEMARLAAELPRLDFGVLQSRGWWARTTGKSRSGGADFASRFEQLEPLARGLAAQSLATDKKQQEHAAAFDRTLLEVEVEYRSIDKIIDQGARWLKDMRGQIKARQAAASQAADQQQAPEDTRCEILEERLMVLSAVSSAAQHAHEQARAAAARRAALLQLLQQALAPGCRTWQKHLSALAAAARADSSSALGMDDAMEAHRELQLCVKKTIAECGLLQEHERVLADRVTALGEQLEAA